MGYNPKLSKSADKYLTKQTADNQLRIADAIQNLPAGNVRKLQGRRGYRLVVSDFRILFDYTGKYDENGKEIIDIQKIGARGDVYK